MAVATTELQKARVAISDMLDAIAIAAAISAEIEECAKTVGGLEKFLAPAIIGPDGLPIGDLTVQQAIDGLVATTKISIAATDLQALSWMRNR